MRALDPHDSRAATRAASIVYTVVLAKQLLVWFALYPLAGYNEVTLAVAQLGTIAIAVSFLLVYRPGPLGLRARQLFRAAASVSVAYGLVAGVVLVIDGGGADVFRGSYSVYALVDNWLVTGFGEELLFAGLLFTLVGRGLAGRSPNISGAGASVRNVAAAVGIVAVLFSLWHLPGYIAIAARTGRLGFGVLLNLLLPTASWLFFGTIYALSGNLWLAAFVHASTDYPLLPAVVERPAVGFLFMAANVALAAALRRYAPVTTASREQ